MSKTTNIGWCDSTLNFWSGCTMVKDQNGKLDDSGCLHCYAKALAERFPDTFGKWGKGAPRRKSKSAVKDALVFNRKQWICENGHANSSDTFCYEDGCESAIFHRRRIFSLSLGDWLDDEVPIEWTAEMLDTIRQCDQVTWILCTKRPENFFDRIDLVRKTHIGKLSDWLTDWRTGNAPTNVILLTSVENQEAADQRIPELLKIPAACRGLSLEPLLDAVRIKDWTGISWAIIGAESGPRRRPCDNLWTINLVEQAQAAGLAVFVKQVSINGKVSHDITEWPERLQVQNWPKGF